MDEQGGVVASVEFLPNVLRLASSLAIGANGEFGPWCCNWPAGADGTSCFVEVYLSSTLDRSRFGPKLLFGDALEQDKNKWHMFMVCPTPNNKF